MAGQNAKVSIYLIGEGFLGPQQSITWWWKMNRYNSEVRTFYAIPKPLQKPYPRQIQIDRVRIKNVTTGDELKYKAYITITNPDPPLQIQEGWPDGCYYELFMAVAFPDYA